MNLKGKNVLVTGACGFIGSHLVESLVKLGARVKAFVYYNSFNRWGWLDSLPESLLRELEVFTGDIRDFNCVKRAMNKTDVVFQLAALISIPYSYRAPESYVDTNIKGTLNVLQAARDFELTRVIHTSTSEVYGTAQYVPIDENHPLQGQSPYSATKIAADKLAEAFHCSFQLPVITVRPFNTFGPRQSDRAIIPTIISQALAGKEICLGSLTPTRDLTYVSDTVEGFIKAAECPDAVGHVINIGTGFEISIGELSQKILNLMHREIPIRCENQRVRPVNSEVERLCSDNSKAKELLGWQPSYNLNQGLKKTIEWIYENRYSFRPGAYVI